MISRDISIDLLENELDINSFLVLERRTSLIYKELLSRRIIASSAYKLPDSLNRIYNKSISIFNYSGVGNESSSTCIKNCDNSPNMQNSYNKTPSPLKKKQHIIEVLSKCRQNFTNKIKTGKSNLMEISLLYQLLIGYFYIIFSL